MDYAKYRNINQKLRIECIVSLKNNGMYVHAKYSNMSVAETVKKTIRSKSQFARNGRVNEFCSWTCCAFIQSLSATFHLSTQATWCQHFYMRGRTHWRRTYQGCKGRGAHAGAIMPGRTCLGAHMPGARPDTNLTKITS
jgi:hypothetical protein